MAWSLKKIGEQHYEILGEVGRDPGTGKRRRIRRRFRGTKAAAKRFMDDLRAEVHQGTFLDPHNLTVAEYFRQWLDDIIALKAKTTQRRYRQIVELRVIPWLGALPLKDLQPIHLREFYKKVIHHGRLAYDHKTQTSVFTGRPLAVDTIKYHHRVIRSALELAFQDSLIPYNIAEKAKPIIPRGYEGEEEADDKVEFLTDAEVRKVEAAAPDQYRALLAVAVRTGLRRGELLGLKWSDIDMVRGTLSVKRSLAYTPADGIHFGPPKTKKSRRTIKISEQVIAILRAHKKRQAEARLLYGGAYYDEKLVFCQDTGHRMHPDTPSSWFPGFIKRLGLPHRTFHSLRHTHASLLLKAGVDIKVISERLGHSSIRITYDLYSHLLPGMEREACEGLENLLES